VKECYKFPPNYKQIVKVFPAARGQNIIFTFGDTIYNPSRVRVPPALLAHEEVHSKRQGKNLDIVEQWWQQYLVDKQFRFDEELLAHEAELRWFMDSSLREKRVALNYIARRLSSPMYGSMVSLKKAKSILEPII